VARAEDAAPAAPSEPQPPAALDLTPRPKPALDFLLLEGKPLGRARDPAFDAKVARRRTLLNVHQAAGIATWALMGTTVVVGQLNYRDLYGGGGYTQKYRNAHIALAASTATAFAFTGILALSAPEPYVKRMRLDTATVHKSSMAVTTLGLVAQIALGVWANQSLGNTNQREIATAHQVLGYATFGAMTVGAVTLLF
jgi:cytochrome b561